MDDAHGTEAHLARLPIAKTTTIHEPTSFEFQTCKTDKGAGNADGAGRRVIAVLDRRGNLHQRWRSDRLEGVPDGLSVTRLASSVEERFGFGSFDMTTTVEISPAACPVVIYICEERYTERGHRTRSSQRYEAIRVVAPRSVDDDDQGTAREASENDKGFILHTSEHKAILTIRAASLGAELAEAIKKELARVDGGVTSSVVVDLSCCRRCDPTGLPLFLTAARFAKRAGGKLVVAGPREAVARLLAQTALRELCEFTADVDAAIALIDGTATKR